MRARSLCLFTRSGRPSSSWRTRRSRVCRRRSSPPLAWTPRPPEWSGPDPVESLPARGKQKESSSQTLFNGHVSRQTSQELQHSNLFGYFYLLHDVRSCWPQGLSLQKKNQVTILAYFLFSLVMAECWALLSSDEANQKFWGFIAHSKQPGERQALIFLQGVPETLHNPNPPDFFLFSPHCYSSYMPLNALAAGNSLCAYDTL